MQRSLDVYYQTKNEGSLALAVQTAVVFYIETELNMENPADENTYRVLHALNMHIQSNPATTKVIAAIAKYYHQIIDTEAQALLSYLIVELENIQYYYPDDNKDAVKVASAQPRINQRKSHNMWSLSTIEIFTRKKLPYNVFKPVEGLTIDSDISEHAAWAFENIYSHNYPDGTPRGAHGIQHVTRVASYIPVLINLYRKHGDKDAYYLDNAQLKLLQIAALFHDAARENDKKDLWDHESGIMLYLYLTRVLGVSRYHASSIAAYTAEKDPQKRNGYLDLVENRNGVINYVYRSPPEGIFCTKTIQQKIIHDADCLDIIRARPHFKSEYLDFYQQFCEAEKNDLLIDDNLAFNELAKLITEVRSLINTQGDGYARASKALKSRYNHTYAWQRMLMDIDKDKHRMLYTLGDELLSSLRLAALELIDLTPYRRELGMTASNMNAAMRESRLFVRGIGSPSSVTLKGKETFAELELRKMFRTPGIKTKSHKPNSESKSGNPLRSLTPIGYGGGVYASAGLLIIEPAFKKISCISTRDLNSGRGKASKKMRFFAQRPKLSETEIEAAHRALNRKMKMGGDSYRYTKKPKNSLEMKRLAITSSFTHPEALIDFDSCNGFYFSCDPTMHNHNVTSNPRPHHPHSPLLQAIYIRELYKKLWDAELIKHMKLWGDAVGFEGFVQRFGHKDLPIFKYSGIHNTLELIDESQLTNEKIIQLWVEMCDDYLDSFPSDRPKALSDMPLDIVKINLMFGDEVNRRASYTGVADASYPDDLRTAVNNALTACIQARLEQYEDRLISFMRDQAFLPLQKTEISELNAKRMMLKLLKTERSKSMIIASNFDIRFKKFASYQPNYFLQVTNYWSMAVTFETLCIDKEQHAAHFLKNIAFNLVEKTLGSCWTTPNNMEAERFTNILLFMHLFELADRYKDFICMRSLFMIEATNWDPDSLMGYARTINDLIKSKDIGQQHFRKIFTSLSEVIYNINPSETESIQKLEIIKNEIKQIQCFQNSDSDLKQLCQSVDCKIAAITAQTTPTFQSFLRKHYQ